MSSFADLLGSGTASDEGAHLVGAVVETISKVHSDVATLLTLEAKPAGLDDILETQRNRLDLALETVFKTNSAHDNRPASSYARPANTQPAARSSPRRCYRAEQGAVRPQAPCPSPLPCAKLITIASTACCSGSRA